MSLDPMPDAETLLRMKAERERRASSTRTPLPDVSWRQATPEEWAMSPAGALERADADDARLEKAIVVAGTKQMRALGFTAWNLSQARASKIAAGVPDVLFTHPARGIAVYWEAKSATGRQRPDQRVFQEHCTATGMPYVLGPDTALYDWLIAQGIAFEEGGLLVPLPYTRTERSA
jgi:hypothetical protein